MNLNETNVNAKNVNIKDIKINIMICVKKLKELNTVMFDKLAEEHLRFHMKSGNKPNLNSILKYLMCIQLGKNLEQFNTYEKYKEHNEIETIRINVKDRFVFIREKGKMVIKSLIGHPRDYNYYK